MGLDIFVRYSPDWSEYDRLTREYNEKKYGKEKDEAEAERLRDALRKFKEENIADSLPEEWREKVGVPEDEDPWYIGYIARSSAAYAFDGVYLDVEGEESFPSLCEIVRCHCGEYAENDWERTLSLARRCLAATKAYVEKGEGRNGEIFAAHYVLERLVPLAELIVASGEPRNFRVMYSI